MTAMFTDHAGFKALTALIHEARWIVAAAMIAARRVNTVWRLPASSALLVVTLVACSNQEPEPMEPTGPPSPLGTWHLNRVAGLALPAPISSIGAFLLEIDAGTLNINDDGTWMASLVLRNTVSGGLTTRDDAGTWIGQGSRIQLTYNMGCTNQVQLDHGTLRIAEDCKHTVEFVYVR